MRVLGYGLFLVASHFGLMQIFRLTTYHRYFLWALPLLVLYSALAGWLLVTLGFAAFFPYQVVLASLWLLVVARHQSRQAATMLAGKDAGVARSMAVSISKTKRYYGYSGFVYVGVMCVAYLAVVGGAGLAELPDPLVIPLVRWLSVLPTTVIAAIAAGIYLAIGLILGADQIGRGVHGAKGPGYTLLGWILLWPFVGLLYRAATRKL